jgi:hypothetical protein
MSRAAANLRLMLAAIAAALAVLLVLYWVALAHERAWPTPIVPAAEALAPQTVSLPSPNAAQGEAFVARPLFVAGRQPVIEIKEEEEAEVRRDVFTDTRLIGVIGVTGSADGGVALVSRAGVLTRVKKGGQFDGWTLDALDSRLARFTHAGSAPRELRLEYDPAPPGSTDGAQEPVLLVTPVAGNAPQRRPNAPRRPPRP